MEITRYTCLRCGHTWYPRQEDPPRSCPKCKSPYWDRERKTEIAAKTAEEYKIKDKKEGKK